MTNRELALHCLETNRRNFICLYHGERDKNGKTNDESVTEQSPYQVTGTPYARAVKGVREDDVEPQPGHLHCGCPEDVVLLDFYLWKHTKITSPVNGVTEGWKDQHLDPRARLLMATAWQDWTGLTVDQIYKGDQSDTEAEVERLQYQVEVIQTALVDAEEKLTQRNEKRAAPSRHASTV